ncbi:hypothetical protein [Intestinirhabdus alba]|uniref:hypothetical protein n=1 Tax=Intestinirhabdus alba TaxID=2899544 RepID=UPI00142EC6D8|nr:hypothetical protein [Intestinirhabdus alba]
MFNGASITISESAPVIFTLLAIGALVTAVVLCSIVSFPPLVTLMAGATEVLVYISSVVVVIVVPSTLSAAQ